MLCTTTSLFITMKLDELKHYINDGGLQTMLEKDDIRMDIIKFVSVTDDGTLMLIIGGEGPFIDWDKYSDLMLDTESIFVRCPIHNVTNYKFCNSALFPQLSILFPELTDIKFISTHDPNFESIAKDCGLQVTVTSADECKTKSFWKLS